MLYTHKHPPSVKVLELGEQRVRDDDAARGEGARLLVRLLDEPLYRHESLAEFVQLLELLRVLGAAATGAAVRRHRPVAVCRGRR